MSGCSFVVAQCGVDDLTIGLDMTGSGCIGRLEEMPGLESRRGKILGDRSSWGSFAHLLGRSVSFWRRDTSRLYVQAKLVEEGELCPLPELGEAIDQLLTRMALVGVTSYEPAWVTRVDVAVDADCRPEDGKLLLDALEACRLPNGWRVRSVRSAALDCLLHRPGEGRREGAGILPEPKDAAGSAFRPHPAGSSSAVRPAGRDAG